MESYTGHIMKVLMLGWEYPPHIAGGLGTACEGLTSALAMQDVSIHFVVPKIFGDEQVEHMRFTGVSSERPFNVAERRASVAPLGDASSSAIEMERIPAFLSPYWNQESFAKAVQSASSKTQDIIARRASEDVITKAVVEGEVFGVDISSVLADAGLSKKSHPEKKFTEPRYSSSIFREVERFTSDVVSRFVAADFDLIHAHDWMTFPAAVALARTLKRPLVAHVHSLEHDRSGVFGDKTIDAIEQFGLRSADKVIAVSHFTKSSIERYHRISGDKISVVHNGVYPKQVVNDYRQIKTWPKHVVLFLGRVTFQKGPEYFVEVAKRVIPQLDDVLFVLAGEGDLLPAVRKQVAELRLGDHFLFPGFVQGEELEELFSVADLYVMPSVSEPFGITALEAISFETPVIISRQSGVAEVLENVLKVDFWDVDRMADMLINVLTNRSLRQELVERAKEEIAHLHWGVAASKTIDVYREVCAHHQQHDS